jgi:uncharacterized metal-binding protein
MFYACVCVCVCVLRGLSDCCRRYRKGRLILWTCNMKSTQHQSSRHGQVKPCALIGGIRRIIYLLALLYFFQFSYLIIGTLVRR